MPRAHGTDRTDFSVWFLDAEGQVLRTHCLYTDKGCNCCHCQERKEPVKIRQAVSYPDGAKKLILKKWDEEIYSAEIPDVPVIETDCEDHAKKKSPTLKLTWKSNTKDLVYLVQWQDEHGVWRGCAPRTTENSMTIEKKMFRYNRIASLRILGSSGIATGMAIWSGECIYGQPDEPSTPDDVDIQLVDIPDTNETVSTGPILRAVVTSNNTKSHSSPDLIWYDEKGTELDRGKSLHLTNLPAGQHQVTARVLDKGLGEGEKQWLIEKKSDGTFRILRGSIDEEKPC